MKKTICILQLILSGACFAQPSGLAIEKTPAKSFLSKLSYIPSKSFTSPAFSGHDSVSVYKEKILTTKGFYAGRFEVNNKEYREFVWYVRDSVAYSLLQQSKKGPGKDRRIDWNDPVLESMILSPEERIFGKKEVDPRKIRYSTGEPGDQGMVSIYPDTLVWINDFSYSYNEPLVKKYFSHREYDDYPVVGVNLLQAKAFCHWKATQLNKQLKQAGSNNEIIVRLPTRAEWEAAATNGNAKDKNEFYGFFYRSNFGTIQDKNGFLVKGYEDDGYFYTNPVHHYKSGPHGLYNIKGNIAEWTQDEAGDLMININATGSFIIVKGGGWNSNPFYLQTGASQFFPATAAHSFIGFRYIADIVKK